MYWYLQVLKKYAVFSGRASRKEYWLYSLFYSLFLILSLFLDFIIDSRGNEGVPLIITLCFFIFHILPSLSVGVRRLHDVGYSGWTLLISLIPILSLFIFILAVTNSEEGENKYGPNPKEDRVGNEKKLEIKENSAGNKDELEEVLSEAEIEFPIDLKQDAKVKKPNTIILIAISAFVGLVSYALISTTKILDSLPDAETIRILISFICSLATFITLLSINPLNKQMKK